MNNEMFYRLNENGDARIFYNNGEAVTRINGLEKSVFPIGSRFSTAYDHPSGIVLSVVDAESIGIEKE